MKISWTLSIAAIALVVGAFPAFANQAGKFESKSSDHKKTEKKIDAAAMTPFMTPHQGKSLKKAVNGGEQMKQDEKLAYPAAGQAPGAAAPQGVAGEAQANPGQGEPNQPDGQAEAPKEEEKPAFRLIGTVCGKGKDLAVFDTGTDWPSMLKAGEKLADGTVIVSVERGRVCLERVTMAAQAAVPAQEAEFAEDGSEVKAAVPGKKAQPEKRERYTLYAW